MDSKLAQVLGYRFGASQPSLAATFLEQWGPLGSGKGMPTPG